MFNTLELNSEAGTYGECANCMELVCFETFRDAVQDS